MGAIYEGKTIDEWVALLLAGDVRERCAAALALTELEPTVEPAREALLSALNDDIPVQAAAQIALDLSQVNAENRRKMFCGLRGGNDETQDLILESLRQVSNTYAMPEAAPVPKTESTSSAADTTRIASDIGTSPDGVTVPNIELVHVLPWWFLCLILTLVFILAWVMRGVWWSPWDGLYRRYRSVLSAAVA
jgi:hypothetical protein